MSKSVKTVIIVIGGLLLCCVCCVVSFVALITLAGYTQVNGICTSRGPLYNGSECPAVGSPVVKGDDISYSNMW